MESRVVQLEHALSLDRRLLFGRAGLLVGTCSGRKLTLSSSWSDIEAFILQSQDVMAAVQRLRARAYANGALQTTPQQTVTAQGDTIIIEPRACTVRTGEIVTRAHPVTGEQVPWEFLRPGHTCGITARQVVQVGSQSAQHQAHALGGEGRAARQRLQATPVAAAAANRDNAGMVRFKFQQPERDR